MVQKYVTLLFILIFSVALIGCGVKNMDSPTEQTSTDPEETAGDNNDTPQSPVSSDIENDEDVSAFFEEVYEGMEADLLPNALSTTKLDFSDANTIAYHTGLSNLSGIRGIYLSESMMGSIAYSAIYVKTDLNADTDAIREQIMEQIDPSKWICVTAEKEISVIIGNDIFFVMGSSDTADAVYAQVKTIAQNKGMSVSEPFEKINPL